jgi:hypothetical protein
MTIVELVKVFYEKGLVLLSEVNDTKSTFILRSTYKFPTGKAFTLNLVFSVSPKKLSSTLFKMDKNGNRNFQRAHGKHR